MIYPGKDRTTLVAEGERWLAWTRKSGERVIAIEDSPFMHVVTLDRADSLRAKCPDRFDDIAAAERAHTA